MTTPLLTALAKLDEDTSKSVHLLPAERQALREYIAHHGISGRFAANSVMLLPKNERPGLRPVQVKP
jgi:hypothetical protein